MPVQQRCWPPALRGKDLQTAVVTGGADRDRQASLLQDSPHIVVATPGRLLDLVDAGQLSLAEVHYLVLDEADKMLDMGLRPQLERIKQLALPQKRLSRKQAAEKGKRHVQVMLFTATMPDSLQQEADTWLRKPERMHVVMNGACISPTITQVVHVCAEHKKPAKLLKHLQNVQALVAGTRNRPRMLIFTNRIKTARFVHETVAAADFRTALLHGDRSQPEREAALADFRSGKAQILVATDVAARGLHIQGLPYVVNYDFPTNMHSYIHRTGRTGRLASHGHCFSFFSRSLAPLAKPLVQLLQEHGQAVDPNLMYAAKIVSAPEAVTVRQN
ncbi:hypothetical protein WJX73_008413 [Symbiochloris irregularis]|uniref:RNA helicase n=1 Tax=Symbiochloris irregularis TaxID=706552 RepID=A0AAW1PRI0_9CHLO